MNSEKFKIIFISQRGYLEAQSLILAKSIRQVYGDRIEVFACLPSYLNQNLYPSERTIQELKQLNIQIKYFNNYLLEKFFDQRKGNLAANKIFAIMEFIGSDVLFLDTDILCNKPLDLNLLNDNAIKIHNEDIDICGINDWERLYKENKIEFPTSQIILPLDHTESPPYYNSGVIFIPSSKNRLMTNEWLDIFKRLSSDIVYSNSFFRDQIALSLVIEKLKLEVELLNELWNFPLNIRKPLNINDIYFIHYHHLSILRFNKSTKNVIGAQTERLNYNLLRNLRFQLRPYYGKKRNLIYKILKGI